MAEGSRNPYLEQIKCDATVETCKELKEKANNRTEQKIGFVNQSPGWKKNNYKTDIIHYIVSTMCITFTSTIFYEFFQNHFVFTIDCRRKNVRKLFLRPVRKTSATLIRVTIQGRGDRCSETIGAKHVDPDFKSSNPSFVFFFSVGMCSSTAAS